MSDEAHAFRLLAKLGYPGPGPVPYLELVTRAIAHAREEGERIGRAKALEEARMAALNAKPPDEFPYTNAARDHFDIGRRCAGHAIRAIAKVGETK